MSNSNEFYTPAGFSIVVAIFLITSAIIALFHEKEFTDYIGKKCDYLRDKSISKSKDLSCLRGNNRDTTWNSKMIAWVNFGIGGMLIIIASLHLAAYGAGDATER